MHRVSPVLAGLLLVFKQVFCLTRLRVTVLRLRKSRLPLAAIILLLFFGAVAALLTYQLIDIIAAPVRFDWLSVVLIICTLGVFIVMIAGVILVDLQSQMLLTRRGIYIEPAIFKALVIPWEDIAELTLENRQGLSLIEYKLKPESPTYQNRYQKMGRWRFNKMVQRSGGFHGWLPVQSYKMEVKSSLEQYEVKVNRIFPILRRYWLNPQARDELPEI